ncbi:hypothetical protein [Endozoicomonas lisbonensis]|uniref:hypothetical protein n=1 Tax=Endozoicomonas lisbonensis TaxID=3120522 RepID=UPI003394F791
MQKLTKNQSQWFKQASTKEQHAFMRKGPAEVANYWNTESEKETFAPVIRGVLIGNPIDSASNALTLAEKELHKLKQQELPTLDERTLGIDGECVKQAEVCYDKELRIDGILHIGSLLATDVFESRWLDGLVESFADHLSDDPEYLQESMLPLQPKTEEDAEFNECLAEHLHFHNFQGFALKASSPVKKYDSCDSASFSWGHVRFAWFYGESFEEAFNLAREWVDRMGRAG